MEYTGLPVIIIICYLCAEIYKAFVKDTNKYKYIPIFVSALGGILGILIYTFYKETFVGIDSPITAFIIGVISGSSATGANQIIKQIFKTDS